MDAAPLNTSIIILCSEVGFTFGNEIVQMLSKICDVKSSMKVQNEWSWEEIGTRIFSNESKEVPCACCVSSVKNLSSKVLIKLF